jgi:hypothetical protein
MAEYEGTGEEIEIRENHVKKTNFLHPIPNGGFA